MSVQDVTQTALPGGPPGDGKGGVECFAAPFEGVPCNAACRSFGLNQQDLARVGGQGNGARVFGGYDRGYGKGGLFVGADDVGYKQCVVEGGAEDDALCGCGGVGPDGAGAG